MPILTTKLHRPGVPRDHVPRPRLDELLNRGAQGPVTLVSAPAGFGKSTLVSNWLDQTDLPGSWLSLEPVDNDVGDFLHYVVAAIRTIFPDACPNTFAAAGSPEPPELETIVPEFINELDAIADPFVLVLDDYQSIHAADVHKILAKLIKQQPRHLHLMILTRRDPSLPLHAMRAGGELVEVRQADLLFLPEETGEFLARSVTVSVRDEDLACLQHQTEGWPAGLRLVALNLRKRPDLDGFLREMQADTRHVQEYLVSEVLSHLEPVVRDGLLMTSVLDRFCPALCDVVCNEVGCDGATFVDSLEAAGLFVIQLDNERRWFRFHHLFQTMLQRTLERRYETAEIAALHLRAADWLDEQGLVEEAVNHSLAGNDHEAAARVVSRHRHELMNHEQFHRLRRLLGQLPRDHVDHDPGLLLAEAWLLIGFAGMIPLLGRIEILLKAMSADDVDRPAIEGEYAALRSLHHYAMGDGREAVTSARKALDLLPASMISARGFAVIMLGVGLQMAGDVDAGVDCLTRALQDEAACRNAMYYARVMAGFCFVHWIEGDLVRLQRVATDYLAFGRETELQETIAHGLYFLGIVGYSRNDLDEARTHLEAVVHAPFVVNTNNYAHASIALGFILLASEEYEEATDVVAAVRTRAIEQRNAELVQLADAFRAEVDLRQGNLTEAVQWAATFDPLPLPPGYRFYVPQLTLARVLLAQYTEISRERVGKLLDDLQCHFRCIHSPRFMVDVLVLQSLRYDAAGDSDAAGAALIEAARTARSGGSVRSFIDQGPRVGELLAELDPQSGDDRALVGDILAECRVGVAEVNVPLGVATVECAAAASFTAAKALPTPLTQRELEILFLLARRLTNREIAERLFISPATVKRHSINLYEKLDVHGRREAVDRASSLGLTAEERT